MSYNILNKNVNFQGDTLGTVEDLVDTHAAQSISGSKDFLSLTGSNAYIKNNLGVGVASPKSKLDVEGGISIGASYSGTTAAPSNGAIIEGLVGIGTNNPSGKLEVVSGNDGDGTIAVRSGNATQYSKISMGTNVNKATIGMAGAADTFFTDTAQGDLVLRADDNNNKVHIGAGTSGIAGMVVTEVSNVGRVGIGVASPSHPLHVVGTISGSGAISGSAFFGDGSALSGVSTILASNGGLTNPSSVSVSPNDATELETADGDDFLLVADSNAGNAVKKITAQRIANLYNPVVSTYNTTAEHCILTQGDGSEEIDAEANLKFDGSILTIVGAVTGSGNVQCLTLNVSGATEVAGNILPSADNTFDLGSASKRFANMYTGDLHLRNDRGDWTIIEEEDYLSVVNNKTGKRYKMMLEEIKD